MDRISLEDWQHLRADAEVIEYDDFGDNVLFRPDGTYLKLFRRKRLLPSALRSPDAQRFTDNSRALLKLGIPCPRVIRVARIPSLKRDLVHYHPLLGDTLHQLTSGGMDKESATYLRDALSRFIRRLHKLGIYFRPLELSNVVLMPTGEFGLINISDLRLHRRPLTRFWRARNLRRIESLPKERSWIDREMILYSQPQSNDSQQHPS